MNKVKANRAEAVIKNTEANELGIEIPTEILESEKGMFHVLYIRSKKNVNKAGIEKIEYNPIVKKYDKNVYPTVKEKYAVVGMGIPHILHDPTLKQEESKKPETVKQSTKVKTETTGKDSGTGKAVKPETVKTDAGAELDYNGKKAKVKELGFEMGATPKKAELDEALATYEALLETAKGAGLEVADGITVQELQKAITEAEA